MELEGGCYCGAVRYKTEGDAIFKGQCHCRECQYGSGGGPNFLMAMPESGFAYTKGEPAAFRRPDLENPVSREFCSACGTQLVSKTSAVPGAVLIKVGTLDDPSVFGQAQMAIFTIDQQSFHQIAEGIATFERTPG